MTSMHGKCGWKAMHADGGAIKLREVKMKRFYRLELCFRRFRCVTLTAASCSSQLIGTGAASKNETFQFSLSHKKTRRL